MHYLIGVLAYVVISRHFIWKLIIWRLSSGKAIIPPSCLDLCIKGEVFVKFLFLGSTSFQIRKKYQKLFSEKLRSRNLKIAYHLLKAFFHSQGKVTLNVTFKTCLLVYKHKCGGSNDTEREFKVRISEHLGISCLPGKKVKIYINMPTAIQEHLVCCNYSQNFQF